MPTPDYTALEKSIGEGSERLKAVGKVVDERSKELSAKLVALTEEIKAASRSSSRLATVMVWLTVVIAAAAVLSAVAAFNSK